MYCVYNSEHVKQTFFPTSHREPSDEQADVSPAHHDDLAAVRALSRPGVLVLPRRPDAHAEDEQVEDDDGHQALCVDGHAAEHKSLTR